MKRSSPKAKSSEIYQVDDNASQVQLAKEIIATSDICVRCGLCLPHCPTYQISELEMESPRGRIAMAKALAEQTTSLTPSMQAHLDNCLYCLACETICPAKVPYHDLLVKTRELQARIKKPALPLLLKFYLNHLNLTVPIQSFFKFYQKTGLAWLTKKIGLTKLLGFAKYLSFMPKNFHLAKFKRFYPAQAAKGSVALFIGCINRLCDAKTLQDAIVLLNAMGLNVYVPQKQGCCGAIHLHSGCASQTNAYLKQNAKAFANLKDVSTIITVASGCHSSLLKIQSYLKADIAVLDINEFLWQFYDLTKPIKQDVLAAKILVHTPCSVKNSLLKPQLIEDLLIKLGFKNFEPLKGYGCCGAAGLNMWNNPKMAQLLAQPIVEQIAEKKPDFVVSANIGCQLHLQNQLHKLGLNTKVCHLINLLNLKKY